MNALQQFRSLAVDQVEGRVVSSERRHDVLQAAGKNENQLGLTVARLLARRTASEGLAQLLGQLEEAQQHLANIAAKGDNVTDDERILHERFKLAAANMGPAYDAGREFLRESAKLLPSSPASLMRCSGSGSRSKRRAGSSWRRNSGRSSSASPMTTRPNLRACLSGRVRNSSN